MKKLNLATLGTVAGGTLCAPCCPPACPPPPCPPAPSCGSAKSKKC